RLVSDWSSDVCSSDLHGQGEQAGDGCAAPARGAAAGAVAGFQEAALGTGERRGARRAGRPLRDGLLQRRQLSPPVQEGRILPAEIGRASWRERRTGAV